MLAKINGALKRIIYSLKYGKKLRFTGIPAMHRNARINILQGNMLAGKGFSAKQGAYFAVVNNGQIHLDEAVSFGRNCITVCHDSITIGKNVFIGPHVMIYDHDHKFNSEGIQKGFRTAPIKIGNNCWIGAGTIILRGSEIGEGCVIGAGTVVRGAIPAHSLVTSNRELEITPLSDQHGKE